MTDGAGKTQEIDNADGAQELNFSEFGITIKKTNAGYLQDAGIGDVVVKAGSATFQIGANEDQNLSLAINDMTAGGTAINLTAAGRLDVTDHGEF